MSPRKHIFLTQSQIINKRFDRGKNNQSLSIHDMHTVITGVDIKIQSSKYSNGHQISASHQCKIITGGSNL